MENVLETKHHQFIDDMAARTVWKYEPGCGAIGGKIT
jgi:hypothetical protein